MTARTAPLHFTPFDRRVFPAVPRARVHMKTGPGLPGPAHRSPTRARTHSAEFPSIPRPSRLETRRPGDFFFCLPEPKKRTATAGTAIRRFRNAPPVKHRRTAIGLPGINCRRKLLAKEGVGVFPGHPEIQEIRRQLKPGQLTRCRPNSHPIRAWADCLQRLWFGILANLYRNATENDRIYMNNSHETHIFRPTFG